MSTLDPAEIERFTRLAAQWYDPRGVYAPIHWLNPVRLRYVLDRAVGHFGLDPAAPRPLQGVSMLDIGCGGGLLCEPLARLGATVTGIDPVQDAVAVARLHARQQGLSIDYRAVTAQELARQGHSFDVVLNMNVLPHVQRVDQLMATYPALLRPGGCTVVAAINRTLRSYCYVVLGLEYVLRWIPRGTHRWGHFIRPGEVQRLLAANGIEPREVVGLRFRALRRTFVLSRSTAVEYAVFGVRPPADR